MENDMKNDFFWKVIQNSTTLNQLRSHDHGITHWARVFRNGCALASQTPGVDLTVVEYFSLFHDAMRDSEFNDPRHGERGAKLAEAIGLKKVLDDEQWKIFWYACEFHDTGLLSAEPTTSCCWDADRLDLLRVGIVPENRFLSTEAAKTGIGRTILGMGVQIA